MKQPDVPDPRGPACVIHGSLTAGYKVKGPFASIDAAIAWIEATNFHLMHGYCSVMLMDTPSPISSTLTDRVSEAMKGPAKK